MKKIFLLMCVFPSMCFGDNLPEIPAIYIDPTLEDCLFENSKIIQNGYVVVNDIEQAKNFFDHLPPDANFDSQDVILFAWSGSGQDKIDYSKDGDIYHFVYKRGSTKDFRRHVKIFVIDKKYDWLFHRVIE